MSSHYSGCLVLTSLFAAVGTAANHLSIERRRTQYWLSCSVPTSNSSSDPYAPQP
jgi:hypothetical protein